MNCDFEIKKYGLKATMNGKRRQLYGQYDTKAEADKKVEILKRDFSATHKNPKVVVNW